MSEAVSRWGECCLNKTGDRPSSLGINHTAVLDRRRFGEGIGRKLSLQIFPKLPGETGN